VLAIHWGVVCCLEGMPSGFILATVSLTTQSTRRTSAVTRGTPDELALAGRPYWRQRPPKLSGEVVKGELRVITE
jgi:hypothetical protein